MSDEPLWCVVRSRLQQMAFSVLDVPIHGRITEAADDSHDFGLLASQSIGERTNE